MKISLFFNVCIVAISSFAYAGGGAICYSEKSAFLFSAPQGWGADYETAKRLGTCVIYYPANHSFNSAPAVIYPKIAEFAKTTPSGEIDLARFIAEDIAPFKKASGTLLVQDMPDVVTSLGLKFVVRSFSGGPAPNEFEEVAYSVADGAIFLAVYSARVSEHFEKYKPAFGEFLSSIHSFERSQPYSMEKEKADQDGKSLMGKTFEGEFNSWVGQNLANAMKSCSRPESTGFNAVLQVSEQGSISAITFESDTDLTSCLKKALIGVTGPKPPFASFHVMLPLKIAPYE